jgi:asparagine synthetase B (glutamine-hydrolysing)
MLIEKRKLYEFDLNQYKKNYDDYIRAFERSVLKRYPEHSIPLVTLSSGLDSGSIACCLNKYNKKSYYYSIAKNESIQTLVKRKDILKDQHNFLDLTNEDKVKWKNYLNNNCEKFYWDWKYNPNVNKIDNGFDQGSMLGKSKIINHIKEIDTNVRVLFSGIGADEVMARNQYYSCGYGNINEFINNLKEIFPWPNFFNGSMENYLKGDEYVGGCFSFETRYPFCDKDVVQEFLWLSPELKNNYKGSIYKPALLNYLDINNFPLFNKKLGFNV